MTMWWGAIRGWIEEETQREQLMPGLIAGLLMGITEVAFSISYGSLIFSGDLISFLPYGIGIALVTAIVVLITISLSSQISAVIGTSQESAAIILGVIAVSLSAALVNASPDQKLATILVSIAVTTILTGIFCFIIGFFKLGRLVRFIPYPVVGGFLAGTGWLLVVGSLVVMTNNPVSWQNFHELFLTTELIRWLPGLLFAVLLYFGLRRFHSIWILPGLLFSFSAVIYFVMFLSQTSLQEAVNAGILLGGELGQIVWQPLTVSQLASADWTAIFNQGGNILVVVILSSINLLLNATALELEHQKDINLNRELKAAGLANLLAGLSGGMVGYQTLGQSSLSYRIKARGRLPGIIAGILCALVFFLAPGLVGFIPIPIMGGILMYLGFEFLGDWVVSGWFKLSRADYVIVIIIMTVIAVFNFLIGVAVGVLAMIILFVLNYSQINVVHRSLSGAEVSSSVERGVQHKRLLAETLGQHIFILELQGYIFFGTANALFESIKAYLETAHIHGVNFILLDFRRVSGVDSSAVFSFKKSLQLAGAKANILVLTNLSDRIEKQLSRADLFLDPAAVRVFPDLDHGLEWCENELLEHEHHAEEKISTTIIQQLSESGFTSHAPAQLFEFLNRLSLSAGDYLIRQGDQADSLYFIEEGRISVQLEMGNNKYLRLKSLGPGTVVGEIGFYLNTPRTASVIADSAAVVYRLTRESLAEMRVVNPDLALAFTEFITRMLAERLQYTTRALEATLR